MAAGTGLAVVSVYLTGLRTKATEQPKAMYGAQHLARPLLELMDAFLGNRSLEAKGPPEAANPHMSSMDVRKTVHGGGTIQTGPLQGPQGPR